MLRAARHSDAPIQNMAATHEYSRQRTEPTNRADEANMSANFISSPMKFRHAMRGKRARGLNCYETTGLIE